MRLGKECWNLVFIINGHHVHEFKKTKFGFFPLAFKTILNLTPYPPLHILKTSK